MATEKISLSDIQGRTNLDYNLIKIGYPLSGYEDTTGPPEATIDSFDTVDITIDTTTFFEGRLCQPEFRIIKDVKALASMLENLGYGPGPKSFTFISENDTEMSFLDDKVIDGDGILTTILQDSAGFETLNFEVLTKNTIVIDSDYLQLVNDLSAPGNFYYYGTDGTGTKGWHEFTVVPMPAVTVTATDESSDYLNEKVNGGDGLLTTVLEASNGEQTLDFSVRVKNSIDIDSDFLQFENDELAPGSLHYYGTNVAGSKGWYAFTEIPMPAVTISDSDQSADFLDNKVVDADGLLKTITTWSTGEQTLDFSVRVKNSIEIDSDFLQLENDVLAPGDFKYYGTNLAGTRGWYEASQLLISSNDEVPDYLENKITDGEGILLTKSSDTTGLELLDFSVRVKNSIDIDSDFLQFENDELAPGNSKFYGTTTGGVKGWQSLPVKKSIEEDSAELQLVNDETAPGTSMYYGTDLTGAKGWHLFSSSTANTVSIAVDDATSGFLNDKLIDGDGLLAVQYDDTTGAQTLDLSVRVKNSIDIDSDFLQFENDELAPGDFKYYGTNLTGAKGWYEASQLLISSNDEIPDYLENKITDGEGILLTKSSDTTGAQTLDFSVRIKNSIEIDSDFLQLESDELAPGNSKFYGTDLLGVKGWQSFPVKNSIEDDSDQLQFVNDENAPGSLHYYGTNVAGTKGWYGFTEIPMPAVTITNSDASSDYLDTKVSDGEGILTTILTDTTGEQTLDFSVRIKNSIEIDSDFLQLESDELAPGNSKFYGTTTGGVKGWQSFPVKNSITEDSAELQLLGDQASPGATRYYGTDIAGTKGWHTFGSVAGATVSVSGTDADSGVLTDKISGGDGLITTVLSDTLGSETLDFSVQVKDSIEVDSDYLHLIGDSASPGNEYYYGTNVSGSKGWYELPPGGSTEFQVTEFDPDADMSGVEVSSLWGMLTTVEFSATDDGAVWCSFKMPPSWKTNLDIEFKLMYAMTTSDTGNVSINASIWVVEDGDTPDIDTPDVDSVEDEINPPNTLEEQDILPLTNVVLPNANISTVESLIIMKLWRDVDGCADNHDGGLQLIKLIAFQS